MLDMYLHLFYIYIIDLGLKAGGINQVQASGICLIVD